MNASRRKGFTLIELLVVISIIALLIAILLPTLQSARSVARSAVCKSNLKQMGLMIWTYSADTGSFPIGFRNNSWPNVTGSSTWLRDLLGVGILSAENLVYNSDLDVFSQGVNLSCPEAEGSGTSTNPSSTYGLAQGWTMSTMMLGGSSGPGSNHVTAAATPELLEEPSATFGIVEQYGLPEGYTRTSNDWSEGRPRWAVAWSGSRTGDQYRIRHQGHSNFLMADGHVKSLQEDEFVDLASNAGGRTTAQFSIRKD